MTESSCSYEVIFFMHLMKDLSLRWIGGGISLAYAQAPTFGGTPSAGLLRGHLLTIASSRPGVK